MLGSGGGGKEGTAKSSMLPLKKILDPALRYPPFQKNKNKVLMNINHRFLKKYQI